MLCFKDKYRNIKVEMKQIDFQTVIFIILYTIYHFSFLGSSSAVDLVFMEILLSCKSLCCALLLIIYTERVVCYAN